MSRPRVLVAEPERFDSEALARLSTACDVVLEQATTETLAAAFSAFDAVWIRLGFRVDRAMLGDRPRCRVLACPATGLDHVDLAACAERGIRVVSLKGEAEFLQRVCATAELSVGLMLALLRNLPRAAEAVRGGEWNRDAFRGRELHEKTVGLVGVGRLGRLVAKMLSGFDVDVLGYDIRADFPVERVRRSATLDELLEASDIVSLHVTYDETTRHLVGAREIARMKRGSFLINTSRGGVVDERALLEALESGHLAGAALDVIEGEPHPPLAQSPLLAYARAHDNLVIVPHIGGNTWESTRKTELFIADKVLAALGTEAHG